MKPFRYMMEMGLCLLAYGGFLILSLTVLKQGIEPFWAKTAISLLPMLPCLVTCYVVLKHLRKLDEFQRKLQLESIGFSFVATACLTFTYGFLENIGFPNLSMFAVWPLMAGFWVLGMIIAWFRHA